MIIMSLLFIFILFFLSFFDQIIYHIVLFFFISLLSRLYIITLYMTFFLIALLKFSPLVAVLFGCVDHMQRCFLQCVHF